MKNLFPLFISLLLFSACQLNTGNKNDNKLSTHNVKASIGVTTKTSDNIIDFIPKGYIIVEQIEGDLNKDNIEDMVLIIVDTTIMYKINTGDQNASVNNPKGVIVLLRDADRYKLLSINTTCLPAENEESGNYMAPDLTCEIENENLLISFGHGRYGYTRYKFKWMDKDLVLVGYDESSSLGPIIQHEMSINFLAKKKLKRNNINKDYEGDNYVEKFEDSYEDIADQKLIKLSEIKDFEALDFETI